MQPGILLANDIQNLECGEEPVARLTQLHQNDMTGLFSADNGAQSQHLLQNITVSDSTYGPD